MASRPETPPVRAARGAALVPRETLSETPKVEGSAPSLGLSIAEHGQTEIFSRLVETAVELAAADVVDPYYARLADDLRQVVPWDAFAVLLFDDANRSLYFRWAEGLDREVVDHWTFGSGQGLVGKAAAAGQSERWKALTLSDGIEATESTPARESDSRAPVASLDLLPGLSRQVAVPLPGRGRSAGVLTLGRRAGAPPFDPAQVRLLELLSRHLGPALEASCAHSTTQRLARNLSLLQETSRELTSILDRERLLETIARIVGRLVEYQLFVVLLWDENEQVLRSVFERRVDEGLNPRPTLRLGEGLCGSAAALRLPVRVGNVHLDPRYVPCTEGSKVKSELAVPLVFEGRLLGVLDVESYHYDAFDAEHEQILSTLGANVAVALENSELYNRLRLDEQRLSRDLHTAREVQRFLLPRSTPWVPGLQVGVANATARDLGGDIYDFLSYDDGRTAFAIGDVAGKGTGAALYGSLAIGLLRGSAADNCCSARDAVAYLDDELRQLQVERRFLALAFAVFDRERRTLEVVNSGLPYPFLLRDGEAREIELGAIPLGTTPLGAGQRPRRPSVTLELRPGDTVVFTTDGIEECLDPQQRPFGSERIELLLPSLAHMPARDLAERLIEATDRHRGPREASDDRTVLVIRVAYPAVERV
ncbi:MAG: SpoIIE family protein phosphatase [Holophagales bacterium]|nr:SpoIIE family protein phosphatase [Holophagales bacterium]